MKPKMMDMAPPVSKPAFKTVRPEKAAGPSILRVARIFEYVDADEKVARLAELFQAFPEQMAAGVCDKNGCALGIVTRVHLFSLLGKPFGIEILSRQPVREIMEKAESFDMNVNLFQTAEQLQESMSNSILQYYLLVDGINRFRGIFSSKDLLTWLSDMTQQDIYLAAQLQESLMEERMSKSGPNWGVEAFNQSAKGLGGDFYHFIPLPDGKIFLALGDVSGKGVAASVLTSLLWGILQFYDYRKGLQKLLSQINDALIQKFKLEKYLTGVFLIFNQEDRTVVIADMGHGHSWLVRNGKALQLRFPETDENGGINLPLGIDPDLKPRLYQLRLKEGDLLCFYTDGLIEQVNEGGSQLGEKAVTWIACQNNGTPEKILGILLETLRRHQGSVPRLDDVTWLQLGLSCPASPAKPASLKMSAVN